MLTYLASESKIIIGGESNSFGSWRFVCPTICGRNWVERIDLRHISFMDRCII